MSASNIVKLQRLPDTMWSQDGYTQEAHLASALLTQPDVLSPVLTHLQGREDKRFPLSFITEGSGQVQTLNDIQYNYPVIGKLNKAVALSKTNTDLKPGIGFSQFELTFPERHFVRQYVIISPLGFQARIMQDPQQTAGGFKYTCQLLPAIDPTAYLPASECQAGVLWTRMFAPVAYAGSRGNESNWASPGSMQNQLTYIRKSYRYEGNVQNKIVNIEIDVNGSKTKLWSDYMEWQYMSQWQEECETLYWYGEYNRDKQGKINLVDDNNVAIPIGSGVIEQIPNRDTYSVLTTRKIKGVVRDALFGASDSMDMNVELFTGTGGMEEFDNAIKNDIKSSGYTILNSGDFMSGSGSQMSYGGFFNQYKHIDGHIVTVRYLPLLDHGPRAMNSPKHPITGLPLESYKMMFLDRSTYDGEANLKMVTLKGREMLRWAVAGASVPPGFSGNSLRASDVDGSSVHFMKTGGINIRRATNCLYLECSIS